MYKMQYHDALCIIMIYVKMKVIFILTCIAGFQFVRNMVLLVI